MGLKHLQISGANSREEKVEGSRGEGQNPHLSLTPSIPEDSELQEMLAPSVMLLCMHLAQDLEKLRERTWGSQGSCRAGCEPCQQGEAAD